MSIAMPYPIPSSSSWQLVDWVDTSYSSPAAAGGVATLYLPQLPPDVRWNLTHMVVGCTSSTATSLRLYLDSVSNGALRDGSNSGNFDVADWPRGLMIPPARQLVAVWNGASDGAIGVLTVQAEVLRLAQS